MAISHKSIIHKPIDYTSPVDLNLLGKVIQYKEAQYDAGVNKVQGEIDRIASMDVAKDSDREYLNAKLNNLVATANGLGGADYSDANVSNQIAGLGSQIYGDEKVVTAVANTKKFRYVQNYYKEMKEKKPKDWNPANEWYDMKRFEGWLSDGAVGSNPEAGAGKVTPYTDYEKSWQETFSKMTANMKTEVTDKGLMYRLDTHKYVSPEQIWDAASKLLTPNQRQQLGIEGRYTYQGLPPEALLKAYDEAQYKKATEAQTQLEDYRAKYKGSTDINDQRKYQKLISDKEAELNNIMAPVKNNAEQIKEKLYLNEKLSGLASRYSYNQSTTKLQAATDKMFVAKHDLDKQKFQYDQRNDAANRAVTMAKEGLKFDGMGNIVPDADSPVWKAKKGDGTGSNAEYAGLTGLSNSPEEQAINYGREQLDNRKVELSKANDQLFKDFVVGFGRKKGLTDVIINDLSDGHLNGKVSPEIQKMAQEMMVSWQAMARGEKINYDTLDPMFKQFASKYQENLKEIQAIDKFYNTIDEQVRQEFGVTPQDAQVVKTYNKYKKELMDLEKQYPQTKTFNAYSGAERTSRPNEGEYQQKRAVIEARMKDLQPFIASDRIRNYNAAKGQRSNELITAASVRFNMPSMNQGDDKEKNVAKMIANNAGTVQWYSESGVAQGKETLDFESVEVLKKGYETLKTPEGTKKVATVTFKYKMGDDKWEIRKVPLNDNQATALGFGKEVKELSGYGFGLHANGEVTDIVTTSGKKYDLQYDLVKYDPSNPNDQSVFVRVKDGKGNTISLYNRPHATYQHAQNFMEQFTGFGSFDEAVSELDAVSKK